MFAQFLPARLWLPHTGVLSQTVQLIVTASISIFVLPLLCLHPITLMAKTSLGWVRATNKDQTLAGTTVLRIFRNPTCAKQTPVSENFR
ncbi:hypothetical protein I79_026102 [Cricetulus griseus]|uniref:Uncharacterized protein n=1 Tax=Cricetulus griseus TaxID=10029 RepID=G3IQ17_CRIGR|nr:hypothetical protein I79_026102 [Cricetulus griseus]